MNSTCELGRHAARALKPYPDYKDSGVEWLGEVPAHWEIRRFKYLLREPDARSDSGAEQLLRVSQYTGVTERKRTNGQDEPDTRAASLIGYKHVQPGELAVNIMLAWNGSMGVSPFTGVVSPAYCVYRFGVNTEPWYFHYLLRSPSYKVRIKAVSTGVVESRLRLYTDDLYRLEGLLPPLSEQAAIVRFLDYADRRIRRYIRAKGTLIALLEEQRQAIIHQAITGRIDVRTGRPYTAMKDSGIEWLGKVPEHWMVLPNRALFEEMKERNRPEEPMLSVTIKRGVIRQNDLLEDSSKKDGSNLDKSAYKLVQPGDIAYNKMRAWQGAVGASDYRGIISPAYVVERPRKGVGSHYFHFLLRMPGFAKEAERWSYGITSDMWSLRPEHFKMIYACLPPLVEQTAIVAYLDKATAAIGTAISRSQCQVELLQEHRIRLIADVVTGKLDVREASTALPEVDPLADEEALHDALEIDPGTDDSELALSAEEAEA